MPALPRRVSRGFHRFTHARWWVHVLATLAAMAVLLLVVFGVLAGLYVDFVNQDSPAGKEIPPQSEPSAEEALELGKRFAPILKLHSTEPFVPISRAAYVSRTSLKEQEGKFERFVKSKLGVDDLPDVEGTCLPIRGCLFFLDLRGAEPDPPKRVEPSYLDIQRQLIREGARPTVYFHVTKYDDTGDYAVQYWFLYIFNFRLNEHESDWEQITVRLDADKNPTQVLYSAHEGANTRSWGEIQTEGEHPVVYPALGSHANYFTAGPPSRAGGLQAGDREHQAVLPRAEDPRRRRRRERAAARAGHVRPHAVLRAGVRGQLRDGELRRADQAPRRLPRPAAQTGVGGSAAVAAVTGGGSKTE